MKDLVDIERMTIYEYQIRMTAYQISELDESRKLHEQAWLNKQINATKQIGKKEVPYFKTFKEFFDYDSKLNEILGVEKSNPIKNDKKLNSLLQKANS